VGYAVASVLNQTFEDFEVIVSDSDETGATKRVVLAPGDARIHHFCSGPLSMADNWEFGRRQARGEYVLMLEDKQALKPRALERISGVVERERHNVITWLVDLFYDIGSQYNYAGIYRNASKQEHVVSSREVIRTFLTSSRSKSKVLLPRGFNSCCHRALIERIVNGPAGRLNLPVAPDYTMSFLQLAYSPQQLHIDEALVVSGIRESNGVDFVRKVKAANVFIQEAGGEAVFFDRVPIKALLTNNLVYNDFLKVRDLVGGNLSGFDLDNVNYFVQCYEDIAEAVGKYGVEMSHEEAEWSRSLRAQDSIIRSSVEEAVEPIKQRLRQKLELARRGLVRQRAKALAKRVGLGKLRRLAANRKEAPANGGFPDILSAIEWEERQSQSQTA